MLAANTSIPTTPTPIIYTSPISPLNYNFYSYSYSIITVINGYHPHLDTHKKNPKSRNDHWDFILKIFLPSDFSCCWLVG